MPVTDEVQIPTFEELDVADIKLSSPTLRATAMHFGKYCDDICKEFMLCKIEERDPRKCLSEGNAVTACGMEFYKKVKKNCREETERFVKCTEWTHPDQGFHYCRKQQAIFDQCMVDKLGIERPHFGYFTQVRVHETDRPKPVPRIPKFDNPTIGLPEDFPREPAKRGWRHWWFP